jgi:hypothetical protein
MSDEKVAHGRSYVKLDSALNFNDFAEGIKKGRSYTSEGKSHIINFKVNDVEMGVNRSELKISKSSKVVVTAKVAAYLNEAIDATIEKLDVFGNVWEQKPFWSIERGRIGNTRSIAVELIVNGKAVATKNITADGSIKDISFETMIDKSSWVGLRILPSSHTNPVFVLVDDKPIRASKQSAAWCLQAVDQCWSQKSAKFSAAEKEEAAKVYEAARQAYQKIIDESVEQ